MENDNTRSLGTNRDPITGAPGAHPAGVGRGAAVGGIAAGAAAGTLAAGPVGTVVGAAVGAVADGLGGKTVAEHFDPTTEGTAPAEQLQLGATLLSGMRNTENNDPEFCEWIESISATEEQLETLISNPNYSLHQAKEHVGLGRIVRRPRYGVLTVLSQFQSRYTRGWKQLMKTLTESGHQRHLPGQEAPR